jgi:hypothetical protein
LPDAAPLASRRYNYRTRPPHILNAVRSMEAGVSIPMVQAFERVIGKQRAVGIARGVIRELARKDSERWAERFGSNLAAIEQVAGEPMVWRRRVYSNRDF